MASAHEKKEAAHHRSQLKGFIPLFENETTPIKAFPVEKAEELKSSGEWGQVKIVHFVRHGNGYHNQRVIELGYGCQCHSEKPVAACPYTGEGLVDARLTDIGQNEAKQLYDEIEKKGEFPVDLILTSPLSRAIETCLIGMGHAQYNTVPRICLEELREQSGVHFCDKRHSKSWLVKTFPSVDFSRISEEDELFEEDKFETREHLGHRIRSFLDFIGQHEADRVAVFAHSSLLFTMSGQWFKTAEMKSFALAYPKHTLRVGE